MTLRRVWRTVAAGMLLSTAVAVAEDKNAYAQHNLVSDLPGIADRVDANLVNPWGLTFGPTTPFWIADNHTGLSTVYNTAGQPFPLANPIIVTIPPPPGANGPAAPTGTIFNGTQFFHVGPNAPARFLFVTEDGTISGWNPNVNPAMAILEVDKSGAGAVYKGVALGGTMAAPLLFATNSTQARLRCSMATGWRFRSRADSATTAFRGDTRPSTSNASGTFCM